MIPFSMHDQINLLENIVKFTGADISSETFTVPMSSCLTSWDMCLCARCTKFCSKKMQISQLVKQDTFIQ